jgi:hypothetical protein
MDRSNKIQGVDVRKPFHDREKQATIQARNKASASSGGQKSSIVKSMT